MIVRYDNYNYLNTEYITHIFPDRNDYTQSVVFFTSGEFIFIKTKKLDEILKKLKVEDIR